MPSGRRMWMAIVGVLAAACAPEVPDGAFACGEGVDCPAGQTCHLDGRCHEAPEVLAACEDRPSFDVVLPEQPLRALDLDVLVVVETQADELQRSLALDVQYLVEQLTNPPQRSLAVDSIHLGVVTTDMGTGGIPLAPSCPNPDFGDDGRLTTTSVGEGCDASFVTPFASFDGTNRDAFVEEVACRVQPGGACGVEQPLEAAL
ncbi:MAG: hypothetical protein KC619_01120, partial [Myxococcales bacterium]|nr:hypothetical protein [Myxococcales bacterium]